ncbi:MAG: FMN-binding protein [Gallicola sp.]|nr:FMN-binding protein [Gallicola sp.]
MKKVLFAIGLIGALGIAACGNQQKSTLKDGEYTGTAAGYGGDIEVKVTVGEGKLSNVEVLTHSETAGISDEAISEIPKQIVEAQNTEVEAISGSTVTSDGIKAAATDAMNQAK